MTWLAASVAVVLLALPLVLLRLRFVAVRIEGSSMEPSLRAGDRVLVRRAPADQIRRGQVVVLRFPSHAPKDIGNPPWLIKRVAALPGDPVPHWVPVPDSYVPYGHLVLLGDNTTSSYDSRRAGYFAADTLLGIVVRTLRG